MKDKKKLITFALSTIMLVSTGLVSLADSVIETTGIVSNRDASIVFSNQPLVNIQSSDGNIVADNSTKLNINRIAGSNRYETAVRVGEKISETDNTSFIVLASGESFVDALTAGNLASEYKCPLLFVNKNDIPKETRDNLDKMSNISRVFIVGGKSSVGFDKVPGYLESSIKRIAGANRRETSDKVFYEILAHKKILDKELLGIGDTYATYDGYNFPDALAATPFMYQLNLKQGSFVPMFPDMTIDKSKKIDSARGYIFGGKSSVPEYSIEGTRFDGSNRYDTSVRVAKAYKTILNKDLETVVITSGEDYPDALSAGPLASYKNVAILLTGRGGLNPLVKKYIEETKSIKNVIIVGGESSVSSQVEKDLSSIVR